MLKPLTIAGKTYPNNLIQGPLAGVSCAPFRELTWRYSQPAFTYTEMISCKTLLHRPLAAQRRFIEKSAQEGPVCFQLSSSEPVELAEAVKQVTEAGADLIDLNCGCPVKKIRSKGAGSRLLTEPKRLFQLISAMKNNTHLPVSIKIRVQNVKETFNHEVAQVIEEAGADFVTVHGRHWTEHYETACRYEEIQWFVDRLSIPVIGNGDVACIDSLKQMLATGCAGAMIARAGVGQPWLIERLKTEMRGELFVIPPSQEIAAVFIEHVEGLVALLESEKFAVLQARKLAKYYGRHLQQRASFCDAINQCTGFDEFRQICQQYLGSVAPRYRIESGTSFVRGV